MLGLLTLTLSLVLGYGLLSVQEARYRGSAHVLSSYQALELARAAWRMLASSWNGIWSFLPRPPMTTGVATHPAPGGAPRGPAIQPATLGALRGSGQSLILSDRQGRRPRLWLRV